MLYFLTILEEWKCQSLFQHSQGDSSSAGSLIASPSAGLKVTRNTARWLRNDTACAHGKGTNSPLRCCCFREILRKDKMLLILMFQSIDIFSRYQLLVILCFLYSDYYNLNSKAVLILNLLSCAYNFLQLFTPCLGSNRTILLSLSETSQLSLRCGTINIFF